MDMCPVAYQLNQQLGLCYQREKYGLPHQVTSVSFVVGLALGAISSGPLPWLYQLLSHGRPTVRLIYVRALLQCSKKTNSLACYPCFLANT